MYYDTSAGYPSFERSLNFFEGRVVDQVLFPRVKIPSSLAFGEYEGKYGFYVTTASTGISPTELQDEGKIHHVAIDGAQVHGFHP